MLAGMVIYLYNPRVGITANLGLEFEVSLGFTAIASLKKQKAHQLSGKMPQI
jgi:hypothetical protein